MDDGKEGRVDRGVRRLHRHAAAPLSMDSAKAARRSRSRPPKRISPLRSQPQQTAFRPRDDGSMRVHWARRRRHRAGTTDPVRGVKRAPALANPHMHFVGTDYATGDRARKTVEPRSNLGALAGCVRERTMRAPYFEALQVMQDADFCCSWSDDPHTRRRRCTRTCSRASRSSRSCTRRAASCRCFGPSAVVVTFGSGTP